MNEPAKHPLTLRFTDDELELSFIKDYIEKSRRPIEVGLWVGLLVYGALFGIMDWVQATDALAEIWALRGGVSLLGVLVLLYVKWAKHPHYLLESVAVLIFLAGIALLVMILLDHSPDAYLDGPVLLVIPAYVLFRLRFVQASIVGGVIFLLYCGVVYFVEGMRATDLLASVIFLFAANLIGMVAGYAFENYARKEFWQTLVIDQERKANAELLEVKDRFFANISHEIRTPLTLIVGPLDDLLEGQREHLPASIYRVLHSVRRSGDRLLKFINQLLELSKVEAHQEPATFRRADLVEFLKIEVDNFQPFAASHGINLTFVHDESEKEFVTDYDKLDVIISNLVSNAIKYTQSGGAVRVSLEVLDAQDVAIEVKDNGAGIPAEALPHIFDRFYRVTAGGEDKAGGLGLGLSLTKAMVDQIDGNITVNSEERFGSAFRVVLPFKEAARSKVATADMEGFSLKQNSASGGSEAILEKDKDEALNDEEVPVVLVVEDDEDVRAYLRESLRNYTVFEAANGEEGLKLAELHVPDLVVSDLMMPGMDGRQFVRQLRSSMMLSHIPFIMLTANASEEAKLDSLEEGVDDYLTKPFNQKELQLRIRNMLSARRSMQKSHQSHMLIEPAIEAVQSSERVFIERIRNLIDERMSDEHFNVDALADELGVSVRQLQRKTKALLGETPNALIRIMRLKKAGHLIKANYGTVSEVAYAVGFNNPTYFTKCFREYFGESPTNWEKGGEFKTPNSYTT